MHSNVHLSTGYKQANIVVLPEKESVHFLEFCRQNAGALPLLHVSKPNDFSAGHLCGDSDVRTDVPAYLKIVDGSVSETVANLDGRLFSALATEELNSS